MQDTPFLPRPTWVPPSRWVNRARTAHCCPASLVQTANWGQYCAFFTLCTTRLLRPQRMVPADVRASTAYQRRLVARPGSLVLTKGRCKMLLHGLMNWPLMFTGQPHKKTSPNGEAGERSGITQTEALLIRARRRREKPKAMPTPKMGTGPGTLAVYGIVTGKLELPGTTCM